jgi:hypothetical protein
MHCIRCANHRESKLLTRHTVMRESRSHPLAELYTTLNTACRADTRRDSPRSSTRLEMALFHAPASPAWPSYQDLGVGPGQTLEAFLEITT